MIAAGASVHLLEAAGGASRLLADRLTGYDEMLRDIMMEMPTMTTDNASELLVFHRFLGDQIASGTLDLSPEESVEAFRAYQRELERLRNDLKPAIDRLERGEPGLPLNIDDVKRRGRERLAREGIL
jgi:hypothetical protein